MNFLTSLTSRLAASTVRNYVTALSARRHASGGPSLFQDPVVRRWLQGLKRSARVPRLIVPSWDLDVVLAFLKGAPFEPLQFASDRDLTLKAVFLVATASARRVCELHALCREPPYFSVRQGGVSLYPRSGFVPKVNTPFHARQALELPSLTTEEDPSLRLLCPCRALRMYLARSRGYIAPDVDNLFVTFGGREKGKAASKHTISGWLTRTIRTAYEHAGRTPPKGAKAHQTRSQAASWAELAGASADSILRAATWSSGNTFAAHYALDLAARSHSEFGRAVLTEAGSSAQSEVPSQPLFPDGFAVRRDPP